MHKTHLLLESCWYKPSQFHQAIVDSVPASFLYDLLQKKRMQISPVQIA